MKNDPNTIVSLYARPPAQEITLLDFEDMALCRLRGAPCSPCSVGGQTEVRASGAKQCPMCSTQRRRVPQKPRKERFRFQGWALQAPGEAHEGVSPPTHNCSSPAHCPGSTDSARPVQAEEGPAASRLRDAVSHFVLRLAFCTSEDNRRWFVAQEGELFKHRYSLMQSQERVRVPSQPHRAAAITTHRTLFP